MDLIARRNVLLAQKREILITWDANYEGSYLRDTGSSGVNENMRVSDLLPISSGNYVFSFELPDLTVKTYRIHEYDTTGQWVRMIDKYVASSVGKYSISFQTQGKYIRISAPKATIDYSIVRA